MWESYFAFNHWSQAWLSQVSTWMGVVSVLSQTWNKSSSLLPVWSSPKANSASFSEEISTVWGPRSPSKKCLKLQTRPASAQNHSERPAAQTESAWELLHSQKSQICWFVGNPLTLSLSLSSWKGSFLSRGMHAHTAKRKKEREQYQYTRMRGRSRSRPFGEKRDRLIVVLFLSSQPQESSGKCSGKKEEAKRVEKCFIPTNNSVFPPLSSWNCASGDSGNWVSFSGENERWFAPIFRIVCASVSFVVRVLCLRTDARTNGVLLQPFEAFFFVFFHDFSDEGETLSGQNCEVEIFQLLLLLLFLAIATYRMQQYFTWSRRKVLES